MQALKRWIDSKKSDRKTADDLKQPLLASGDAAVPRDVTPIPSILAYKMAVLDGYSEDQLYAIVWMQINLMSEIYPSHLDQGLALTSINDLKNSVKYCTNKAMVLGVQFAGKASTVTLAYEQYCKNPDMHVRSNFDRKFVYRPNHEIVEPAAGKAGTKGCRSGIHFFTEPESAVEYSQQTSFQGFWPVVTSRISEKPRSITLAQHRKQIPNGLAELHLHPGGKRTLAFETAWGTSGLASKDEWLPDTENVFTFFAHQDTPTLRELDDATGIGSLLTPPQARHDDRPAAAPRV